MLKATRRQARLSQKQAALAIGVKTNTIWRYENDRLNPSNQALIALSVAFGKPSNWFSRDAVEDGAGIAPELSHRQKQLVDLSGQLSVRDLDLVLNIVRDMLRSEAD